MSNEEKMRAALKARLKLSEDMRNMGRPPHPDYWVQSICEVEAQMREALAQPITPPAPAVPQATAVTHDMREAGVRAAREVAEILNAGDVEHIFLAMLAAAPAVPGWKWVPVEPTPDMEGAGRVNMAYGSCTARQVWSAMLAAAPAAPSQEPVNRPQNCGTSYCSCIECVCEPEPVTLTDEAIDNIADEYEDSCGRIRVDQVFPFASAIIAALREKEKAK